MDASSGQLLEMQNNTLQNMLECSKTQQDRKPRPEPEQALKCPRCESTNTKFCYYNNYSLSQPRYFCKSCRRYWTKGGTLRNVPVGGGCRKNKRSSSTTQKRIQDQSLVNSPSNPPLTGIQTFGGYDSNDLALAFAALQQKQYQQQLGYEEHDVSIFRHQKCDIPGNHNVHTHTTTSVGNTGFLDALRIGYLDNQNGSRNLFSNYGGNIGDVNSNSTHGSIAEMVLPYDQEISTTTKTTAVTVETVKQEMCNVARESENKVLWGFPWQLNGDENMSDVAASSWHGLINSPLPLM